MVTQPIYFFVTFVLIKKTMEIRCPKCEKKLCEADGEGTVTAVCPRCKKKYSSSISYQDKLSATAVKK